MRRLAAATWASLKSSESGSTASLITTSHNLLLYLWLTLLVMRHLGSTVTKLIGYERVTVSAQEIAISGPPLPISSITGSFGLAEEDL